MKPAEMNSVASVAISTIGSFFGKYGVFDAAAREMMRASAGAAKAVARRRLAIFGEIGFEQIALRLGLALQRAQLHVLPVGRGGLLLELVEAGAAAFRRARLRCLSSFSNERASRSASSRIC